MRDDIPDAEPIISMSTPDAAPPILPVTLAPVPVPNVPRRQRQQVDYSRYFWWIALFPAFLVACAIVITGFFYIRPITEYNDSLVLWPTFYNNTRVLHSGNGCTDISAEVVYIHPTLSCQPWPTTFTYCGTHWENGTAWLGADGCPVEPLDINGPFGLIVFLMFILVVCLQPAWFK